VIELCIVVLIIGVLIGTATPFFLSFLDAERTRAAAREVAVLLNQARQLAITKNSSYTVQVDQPNNRLRFCSGTAVCADDTAAWKGAGTDSSGYFKLTNESKIACGGSPTFSALGAATTAATLRVQNSNGTSSSYVVVSASGRIQTASSGTCS